MITRLVVCLLISTASVIGLAGPASIAMAQEAEDARTLFQRGQQAYSQGDYDGAVEQWTRAYALDARPLLQFNLSQAYERLGRLEDAIASLQAYLDHADPADEHQADARARIASLRERIARTSVRIVGGPEGATILVDGEDRGRTPRPDPIQVSPGSHRVVVRAAGQEDFNSSVAVPAGQTVDVTVEMTATAAIRGDDFPLVPVVLFATGGAAIVVGAVMGAVALTNAETAPSRDSPEADGARGLALGADITMGVGIACAVAGLIVLLVTPSSSDTAETATATITPWGSPEGGGVGVSGRF